MTLFFHLPEPDACSGPSVLEHACSDGRVNRNAEWCRRMAEVCATAPYLSPEEKAEKASKVAAVRFADEFKRRDLLS